MLFKRLIPLLLYLFLVGFVSAQPLTNLRQKTISTSPKVFKLDSLSIEPNSFWIKDISKEDYKLDFASSTLAWIKKPAFPEVEVHYRVLSINLASETKRMSFDSVMYRFGLPQVRISNKSSNQKPFDFGKINSNGSLGRSLSFGNRQDAVLNSSLNLQLNGYIGDSILLAAAISDNNIPIQPDGNTQNLKEFDQVYIQFSKDKWKLLLGDFDLRRNDSYYLNFYKRVQGISFESADKISSSINNSLHVSGAVAKGKFTRNVFQGSEGNQGPYRLKGANQEMFFIVLAGTERVFIDGVLMERGEDQDYVINYNTAEVTFTPKQMITKDKRIQIEFEYADRNYLNSQLYLHDEVFIGTKFKMNIGFFNNGDAKNSPISQTLNTNQKQFLSTVGDNLNKAYYSSAMADTFANGKILYKQVDTIYNGNNRDTIYQYTNLDQPDLFTLSFIDLGDGGGNYIQDLDANVNGKVYKWVSPDISTGLKSGRFEPVVLIAAPKSQRLISIGTEWDVSKSSQLLTDVAFSKFDLNRFSSKDKSNDDGIAGRLIFKNTKRISADKGISLTSDFNLEYTSSTFKPIERLRNVEFNRDWGLDLVTLPADEKLASANFNLLNEKGHSLKYSIGSYARDENYKATRNYIEHHFNERSWRMDNIFGYTSFNDGMAKGYFLRPSLNLTRTIEHWSNQEFGVKYSLEKTTSSFIRSDSLKAGSFAFNTFQVFTQSDQSKMNKWGLNYFTRTDQIPFANKLQRTDRSHNYSITSELLASEHHQVKFSTTFRQLEIINSQATAVKPDKTLLGRVQYLSTVWKGAINGDMLYELGTGQEPRKDFAFFEVPAGQGEYTWIDYNNDGVQQLNEFEIAKFRDQAKFFRIATPTNEFIKADYLQFNYNVVINPSQALSNSTSNAFINFIKKLYVQSALQINKKQEAGHAKAYNPFDNFLNDTSLITFDRVFSNSFSFNKMSQVWGLDINTLQTSNRAYLSYGYETRSIDGISFKIRSNWFKVITVDFITKMNRNILETPKFSNRNYNVSSLALEPRITFTQGTNLRLMAGYKIDDKQNKGPEAAKINAMLFEAKYNLVSNTAISTSMNFSKISFNGNANTSVGYIMLEGLLPGKNFIWTLDLTKRLNPYLEMTIQYEGRKAGSSGMVNIGRAQIRAIL